MYQGLNRLGSDGMRRHFPTGRVINGSLMNAKARTMHGSPRLFDVVHAGSSNEELLVAPDRERSGRTSRPAAEAVRQALARLGVGAEHVEALADENIRVV